MSALAAALDYRARGWAVLPIESSGKRPHFDAIERVHGTSAWSPLAARPATEPEIRAWYEHDPDANVGIILGQPSGGLVVADVDRPRQTRGLRHPPTAIVQAKRGPHIYLRASGKLTTIDTPYGELRGDGSYVVAPPSQHESGHEYYWLVDPIECEAAPVEDLLSRSDQYVGTQAAVLLPMYPEGVTPLLTKGGDLAKLDSAVQAAIRTWGVTIPLGKRFSCVLPGHGPDRDPSASLFRGRDDVWRYRDWHAGKHDTPPWLTLADVHASRSAGRVMTLSAPSQARWYRRLFFDAGLIAVDVMQVLVPDGCSAAARKVAEGFGLLLGIRNLTDGGPAPFTRTFAAAWCGIGERQAGDGITELLDAGVIHKAGRYGRTNLYLPGRVEQRAAA